MEDKQVIDMVQLKDNAANITQLPSLVHLENIELILILCSSSILEALFNNGFKNSSDEQRSEGISICSSNSTIENFNSSLGGGASLFTKQCPKGFLFCW
jgi:hypothetical protein